MENSIRGLTLIELMVTLAVIAVLVMVGVPKYQQFTENNRMVANINRISGDLSKARDDAVNQAQTVTVCASTDLATCNSTDWEKGWIAFTDLNRNQSRDGNDQMLFIGDPLPKGLTLRTVVLSSAGVIQFLPSGLSRDMNGSGSSNGTFKLCDAQKQVKRARAVNVSNSGNVSLAQDTNTTKDGIVNDVNGNNITCP